MEETDTGLSLIVMMMMMMMMVMMMMMMMMPVRSKTSLVQLAGSCLGGQGHPAK